MAVTDMPYERRLYCYELEKRHILFGPHGLSSAEVDKALAALRNKWRI